jgi:very-short-patch-repair endonuclease
MRCDFVLADAATLAPVLVVELAAGSHRAAATQQRDAFKDTALRAAGAPLLRVPARRVYDAGELGRKVEDAIRG